MPESCFCGFRFWKMADPQAFQSSNMKTEYDLAPTGNSKDKGKEE